jgi:methylated-DNA-protein-cysteine methyltransferase-like protein
MSREKDPNDIYMAIYDVVRKVPKGRVTTYGHIAAAIGMKSGARMVGYAMNHCHGVKPKVPAHRVVNSAGLLTGKAHFGPGDEMADLLAKEGITVSDNKVQNFSQLLWDPAIELGF